MAAALFAATFIVGKINIKAAAIRLEQQFPHRIAPGQDQPIRISLRRHPFLVFQTMYHPVTGPKIAATAAGGKTFCDNIQCRFRSLRLSLLPLLFYWTHKAGF